MNVLPKNGLFRGEKGHYMSKSHTQVLHNLLRYRKRLVWIYLGLMLLGLAACSGSEPPTSTPDLVATEVAVQQAAAATLTAQVPEPPPTSTAAEPTPTNTTAAAPQTATGAVPTATPSSEEPTATSIPPTNTPPAAEPTPTLPIFDILPVDGDSGNPEIRGRFNRNEGRYVVIPDVSPGSLPGEPPEFRDGLVFQVEPYDPAIGTDDGDGIRQVNFTIINRDNNDEEVYTRTEQNPRFCAFGGGEPNCTVFDFQQNDFRWPDGPPLENANYRAVIEIVPIYSDSATWNWDFAIRDVPQVETADGEIVAEIVQIGWGNLDQTVTTDLVFQVEAYHTGYGNNDGDGIEFVEMFIRDSQGEVILDRVEQNAAYCAFSGGEPNCNRLPLDNIDTGTYTLEATVHAITGQTEFLETTIEIP